MSEYRVPIRDMLLVLNELARLDEIAQMPGSEEASADVVSAVLEEASRFAEENHGLECMFIMMNVARFAVGMGGVVCERATTPRGAFRATKLVCVAARKCRSSFIQTCGAC